MDIDKEKLTKALIKYSIIVVIAIVITPYLTMFAGLAIMLIGAFSTSPTINLLRFRTKRIFKSAEVDVEDLEDPDKIYNISWKESMLIFFGGLILFIISLFILSYGWNGVIFYL